MNVIWLESARKQLEEILEYISTDSPQNAEKYTLELFVRVNNLLQFPDVGKIYTSMGRRAIRKLIVDKTKFVLYRTEKNNVVVLTLRDTRTNWKK